MLNHVKPAHVIILVCSIHSFAGSFVKPTFLQQVNPCFGALNQITKLSHGMSLSCSNLDDCSLILASNFKLPYLFAIEFQLNPRSSSKFRGFHLAFWVVRILPWWDRRSPRAQIGPASPQMVRRLAGARRAAEHGAVAARLRQ